MQQTTIKLNPTTKSELDKFKQYENESYDELVRKLVRIVLMCKKQPKLSQKTINAIEEARAQIKKGKFYSEEEAKKILGI
jgi:predicted transcriptional regulator